MAIGCTTVAEVEAEGRFDPAGTTATAGTYVGSAALADGKESLSEFDELSTPVLTEAIDSASACVGVIKAEADTDGASLAKGSTGFADVLFC